VALFPQKFPLNSSAPGLSAGESLNELGRLIAPAHKDKAMPEGHGLVRDKRWIKEAG